MIQVTQRLSVHPRPGRGPKPALSRHAGAGAGVAHHNSYRFTRQVRCDTIPCFGRGPIVGLRFRIRLFSVGTSDALLLDISNKSTNPVHAELYQLSI